MRRHDLIALNQVIHCVPCSAPTLEFADPAIEVMAGLAFQINQST
jgi:hypothetical protein